METLRLRSVFRTNRLAIKDTTIGPGIKIKAGQSNISFRDYRHKIHTRSSFLKKFLKQTHDEVSDSHCFFFKFEISKLHILLLLSLESIWLHLKRLLV